MLKKKDWIILRVLFAALRGTNATYLHNNPDIRKTITYLTDKYGYKTFDKAIAMLEKEKAA